MHSPKGWSIISLCSIVTGLLAVMGTTAVIDPYFHYHKPLKALEYPLYNERYQNDGIIKHFDYDAIITGTSMTQNFKTTEFDTLFHTQSIKVPFAGAGFKEITENLSRAIKANPDIRYILRGIDYNAILFDKDFSTYDSYPDYLYDDNIFNDTKYLLNKDIFLNGSLEVLNFTKAGLKTPTFDEYNNWMKGRTFGKEAILSSYPPPSMEEVKSVPLTNEDLKNLRENIHQNFIVLANENPDIEFYLFITPYSIYFWDSLYRTGNLERQLEAEKIAIEMLLGCNNIKLFSFYNNYDMICNADNYKDTVHYSEDINSKMLNWMHDLEYQLTLENYRDYCNYIYEFYTTFNYDSLF